MSNSISTDNILPLIHTIRGVRVILAADLAKLYGVETKQLNQQIKRNLERFPSDFMFQLTPEEWESLRGCCESFCKMFLNNAMGLKLRGGALWVTS